MASFEVHRLSIQRPNRAPATREEFEHWAQHISSETSLARSQVEQLVFWEPEIREHGCLDGLVPQCAAVGPGGPLLLDEIGRLENFVSKRVDRPTRTNPPSRLRFVLHKDCGFNTLILGNVDPRRQDLRIDRTVQTLKQLSRSYDVPMRLEIYDQGSARPFIDAGFLRQ